MEHVLSSEILGALTSARQIARGKSAAYRVVVGARSHPVVELRSDGFVIEADGRPPLRGYADVFLGDERVVHGLVMCSWARDGQVGYDFKRDTLGTEVPADHVRPAHSGLLESPG